MLGVVTILSPAFRPRARPPIRMASVPDPTPAAKWTPTYRAKASSKALTSLPMMNSPPRHTLSKILSSDSLVLLVFALQIEYLHHHAQYSFL